MLRNAHFRTNEKFLCIRLLRVLHNAGGRTHIVRAFHHHRNTFRMNQYQRIGVRLFCTFQVAQCNRRVHRTSALHQLNILFRHLTLHKIAQITVRNKQNLVVRDFPHNRNRRGTRHAHIAFGFQRGCGVDIRHHRAVRLLLFQILQHFRLHLLRHGTSRQRVC